MSANSLLHRHVLSDGRGEDHSASECEFGGRKFWQLRPMSFAIKYANPSESDPSCPTHDPEYIHLHYVNEQTRSHAVPPQPSSWRHSRSRRRGRRASALRALEG